MDEITKKHIRFINSEYETLFFVDDGGEIEIRIDGIWEKAKCRYIDECHTEIGRIVYHICEFAEKRERFGQPYRPVSKTPGFPVMVRETVNAFTDLPRIRETRREMTDEYRAAADCLRRKAERNEGESKTGFLNSFLDGYFYALKLSKQEEAADA
jgi:hypothetical protein